VAFSSEDNAGYLIKEVEMGGTSGSQSGEEECVQAFCGET
jgi:hypothetical protein